MAKMLTRCPVCESGLRVSELTCPHCATRIQSAFDPCRFCQAAPEHLAFVETFLRCEGNLSRVEKELGVSYPTVRNRLTAALSALGLAGDAHEPNGTTLPNAVTQNSGTPPVDSAIRRKAVLDALGRGELSAEEAANALRDLS